MEITQQFALKFFDSLGAMIGGLCCLSIFSRIGLMQIPWKKTPYWLFGATYISRFHKNDSVQNNSQLWFRLACIYDLAFNMFFKIFSL